jgi:hypothetical protein
MALAHFIMHMVEMDQRQRGDGLFHIMASPLNGCVVTESFIDRNGTELAPYIGEATTGDPLTKEAGHVRYFFWSIDGKRSRARRG